MTTSHAEPERLTELDGQLVDAFVERRDERAFGELVRRHGPLVLGVCRRVLGEVHEAEDAFQATFLVLARDARKIRRRHSLSSWLHSVAYRVALRAARKRSHPMDQLLDDLAAAGDPVLESIARRHEERMVDEELHRLPDKDRESLTLRYLEDLSHAEIAAALQISVAAVEGRLKRARDRLRRQLLQRGISLSFFLGLLTTSRVELSATESLIARTIELGLAGPAASPAEATYPHQLAATEIGEMALSIKTAAALAATALLTLGLGLYGLSTHVVGQESNPTVPLVVQTAEEQPAANEVRIVKPDRTSETELLPSAPADSVAHPGPVLSSARLSKAQQISRSLDQETILEFNDAPLVEIVDYMKTANHLPIVLDMSSLDDIGVQSDVPISISVSDVTLRSALAHMLNPLNLDYVIRNEVLTITSAERAREQLDPRIYRVDQLVDSQEIPDATLIELITTMVAPDTWEQSGGTGRILSLSGTHKSLVIAQTDQIHAQVADLLAKLQEALREP